MNKFMTTFLWCFRALVMIGLVGALFMIALPTKAQMVVATYVLITLGSYMIGALACFFLPFSWTCDWAGTHRPSSERSHDGASNHSICRKCGVDVMQDSQGNWF
jgi:hypothetical protein